MTANTKRITYTDPDTEEERQIDLPAFWVICTRCCGNGKHVNPAIDGHGLSREDFDEDPDFKENYLSGMYDIPCEPCSGSGKVLEINEEACTTSEQKAALEYLKEEAQYEAEARRERMWESRMLGEDCG